MGDLVELCTFQLTQKTIPLKELRKWKLFNPIGDGFLQNIRLAHVHDEVGFLVTANDDVYAINICTSPGIRTRASIPIKIDPLCRQTVKSENNIVVRFVLSWKMYVHGTLDRVRHLEQ